MSVAGKFSITMHISVGAQKGTVVLNPDGETLSGNFKSILGSNDFSDGTVEGNKFAFTFTGNAPMLGKQTFNVSGEVDGDSISGTVKMPMGSFEFQGQREE